MYLGLLLKLGKNLVMSVHGLLGERTKGNAHGGNIGIMGEICVSLCFLPCYFSSNIYVKTSTIDEDYVYMTQSMFT